MKCKASRQGSARHLVKAVQGAELRQSKASMQFDAVHEGKVRQCKAQCEGSVRGA
jgi:hypothetical protein